MQKTKTQKFQKMKNTKAEKTEGKNKAGKKALH